MNNPKQDIQHTNLEPDANSENHSGQSDSEDEDDDFEEQEESAQMLQIQAGTTTLAAILVVEPEDPNIPDSDDNLDIASEPMSQIDNVCFVQKLIQEISLATLKKDKLNPEMLENLKHPDTEPVDISDPDTHLSLDLFMSCNNASQATYNAARESILHHFPNITVLSYYSVKKLVLKISGVDTVLDDMCIKSCVVFVGPFADLKACSECSKPCYNPEKLAQTRKEVLRQQACTIPLGPQLQALRHSHQGAAALSY